MITCFLLLLFYIIFFFFFTATTCSEAIIASLSEEKQNLSFLKNGMPIFGQKETATEAETGKPAQLQQTVPLDWNNLIQS